MAQVKEVSISELIELLKPLQSIRFGVGVHSAGLQFESIERREQIAKEILESGVKLGHGYASILGNIQSEGRKFDLSDPGTLKFVLDDILRRVKIDHGRQECKVIVAAPTILQEDMSNPDSQREVLGFPERSFHSASKQYTTTCLLDIVCKNLGEIPKEFILGYVVDGKENVTLNPDFYGFLDPIKQKELFDRVHEALGIFKKASRELIEQGLKSKNKTVEDFSIYGFSNPEKLVDYLIEEIDRMNGQKEEPDIKQPQETNQEKEENLERKMGAFYEATHPRKLVFRRLDVDFARENKDKLKSVYTSMGLQDVMQVDDDNSKTCKRTIEDIKRLPKELRLDEALKEELKQRVDMCRKKMGARRLVTDDIVEERKEIEELFKRYIAAYLMLGGKDVQRDCRDVIDLLNKSGMKANVGQAVVSYGKTIANRMEELNQTSNKNGEAWNLLLEPVFHAYIISKEIGNERYNPTIHKEFEKQLVRLGIIEIQKGMSVAIKTKSKEKIKRRSSKKDDKDETKQTISLEQQRLKDAMNAYINTGMVPNDFVLEDDGKIRPRTQLEMMRLEQTKRNLQAQRGRELEKQKRLQMQQRVLVGIGGQPIVEKPKQQVRRQERVTQKRRIETRDID